MTARATVATVVLAAACAGGSAQDAVAPNPVAPPVNLLSTLPGTYALKAVDGQSPPIETARTVGGADTLVSDTLYLSGRVDSSVARTRVMRWVTFSGIGAGPHAATFSEYDGGWRVRGGKPFIWASGADSVAMSVPDVATVAFARQGHLYVYKR